jgi:hypothetical protein
MDIDNDDLDDIILGGNLFGVKPQVGRYDGLRGLVLKNLDQGEFKPLSPAKSGLRIEGEIRHITTLGKGDKLTIVFVRNNNTVLFYRAD